MVLNAGPTYYRMLFLKHGTMLEQHWNNVCTDIVPYNSFAGNRSDSITFSVVFKRSVALTRAADAEKTWHPTKA